MMAERTCRIEVNRMDDKGWRAWGCGRNMLVAMADHLIAAMGQTPEAEAAFARGEGVPSKMFRKVPPMSPEQAAVMDIEDDAEALAALAWVVGGGVA